MRGSACVSLKTVNGIRIEDLIYVGFISRERVGRRPFILSLFSAYRNIIDVYKFSPFASFSRFRLLFRIYLLPRKRLFRSVYYVNTENRAARVGMPAWAFRKLKSAHKKIDSCFVKRAAETYLRTKRSNEPGGFIHSPKDISSESLMPV